MNFNQEESLEERDAHLTWLQSKGFFQVFLASHNSRDDENGIPLITLVTMIALVALDFFRYRKDFS